MVVPIFAQAVRARVLVHVKEPAPAVATEVVRVRAKIPAKMGAKGLARRAVKTTAKADVRDAPANAKGSAWVALTIAAGVVATGVVAALAAVTRAHLTVRDVQVVVARVRQIAAEGARANARGAVAAEENAQMIVPLIARAIAPVHAPVIVKTTVLVDAKRPALADAQQLVKDTARVLAVVIARGTVKTTAPRFAR